MNKILGSLFLLISAPILALSTASVNQSWAYLGDQINLTLSSDGDKVSFPVINEISGNPVLFTSNTQKIRIVNNQRLKQSSKTYTFKPSANLKIPAYTLIVDGIKQFTQSIDITVKKPTQAKLGDDYMLSIEVDKNDFFLGDEIILKITFKQKKSITGNDQLSIAMPDVKNLLFIKDNNSTKSTDEDYLIHAFNYKISASDFGTFIIPSVVASIGNHNNNLFSNFSASRQVSQLKKIHSNPLTITVKPLPDDLRIFGDFNIQSQVDKHQVTSGQAVNLTIIIKGSGNFEDIEKFDISIDDATIYSNDAEFNHKQWQQKFAIISELDFTIPSLTFDYFDKTSQSKKRIITKAIDIQVEGLKSSPILDKKIDQKPSNFSNSLPAGNLKYYYLLLGIVVGVILGILITAFKNKKPNSAKNLITQIKLARGDKALFDLLLPLNNSDLEVILQKLEANIYKNSQHKIRKKDVINAIKFKHKAH